MKKQYKKLVISVCEKKKDGSTKPIWSATFGQPWEPFASEELFNRLIEEFRFRLFRRSIKKKQKPLTRP